MTRGGVGPILMDPPSLVELEVKPRCPSLGWVVLPSGVVVGFDAAIAIVPPGLPPPDYNAGGCEYLFDRLLSASDYAAAYRYARDMAHRLPAEAAEGGST